jgi:isoleucyl-tRNA synthetase
VFQPVPSSVNFPQLEEDILRFWREADIYEKSLARRRAENASRFVFYEGPPTANGMPHPGHCLTRAIKDLFPRYRTMRGYLCERKAGWDTHGLPVEVEVCKELGIHSKEEIEKYGIEPFIQKCQQSVWRYMQEWRRMTERIGFWVNLDEAYVTYHQSYVESVWWSLKQLFDRGLMYQGHKIVWWWAQGGTALSSGEVGLGYREVADPSVYVKFPLLDDDDLVGDSSLLVWTTTPWTLPSNQFAAVHPDLEYSVLGTEHDGKPHRLIVASALAESLRIKSKQELPEVDTPIKGTDLIRRRYVPPFDSFYKRRDGYGYLKAAESYAADAKPAMEQLAWRVIGAPFVTTDSGTGIVHLAPAFGEDDFDVLMQEQRRFLSVREKRDWRPELINAVAPDGKFTDEAPDYCRGRWVKDCDKDIIRDLNHRGLLFHREEYRHEYPFCWRAEEDPLIQYPRKSWFIRTSNYKEQMLDNNRHINWLPEHIKEGRMGNFLATNVDWALSRERFWGTPLPIWQCDTCNKQVAIANYEELTAKPGIAGTDVWEKAKAANPNLPDDLKVHKPYIDAVTFKCDRPNCAGTMRRVTEVIDCWYDSGAMPFAQWGYQGEGQKVEKLKGQRDSSTLRPLDSSTQFHEQFPADFISEALDQTRGWFYSQLAISTLVFDKPTPRPFRNCIVLGLMLGEDGQKMSKSKRNYREPSEIFDKYGADALRWYFFATQPPWTTIRYSERAIRDSIPEFLLRLWHTYSFFVIYANIDGFEPSTKSKAEGSTSRARPIKDRSELDRWILSELNRTAAAVVERMDAYDNYAASQRIIEFVDALSNWYVRRSRDRFWAEDKDDPDKLDAYWTLYECLITTCKIIAPFVPFLAEAMWRNLAGGGPQAGGGIQPAASGQQPAALESVHLTDFPTGDPAMIDEQLSAQMDLVREIASLGLSARMGAKLKVRQPMQKVEVILADRTQQTWLEGHIELLKKELNVKQVEFTQQADHYITYTVLPDLKRLGPRLGKKLPLVKNALAKADAAKLLAEMESAGSVALKLDDDSSESLDREDLQVRLQAKPGWAAAQGKKYCVVVLATELTPDLVTEGVAREIVHSIQSARKDTGCEYTDRIEVGIVTNSEEIRRAVEQFADYIRGETLAVVLKLGPIEGVEPIEIKIGEETAQLYIRIVNR